MSDETQKAELHIAWVWDCDHCGAENFERSAEFEADEETIQWLREEHGVDPRDTGGFQLTPTEVTCRSCNATYEVEGQSDE